jgi:hypothetical protein
MNNVFTLKFVTLVFTFFTSTLTLLIAPITVAAGPQTLKKMDSYELFYITENRWPGSDCYREVFKVTLVVTELKWSSD